MFPVLPTVTLPPPASPMPVIVSSAAVLVSVMSPLAVLLAWKLLTVLFGVRPVPVAELVVSRPG